MSQVWIPVNASMRGFATTVAKEAAKAAGVGGKSLEAGFQKSGAAAGAAAGEAVADSLAAAAGKVDAASRALATARKAEATAAADVAIAEERLSQLRASGTATEAGLIKAATDLEVARAKQATATERVTLREADLNTVRDGGDATSSQLVRAEDKLAAARIKVAETAGRVASAEADLEDAKQDAFTATERVEDAEAALADARARYGDDSREAAAAERELNDARKAADRAALDVAKSEGRVRKAVADSANATDDARSKAALYEGVQRDLADAERRAGAEAEAAGDDIRGMGDDMASASGEATGLTGGLVDLAKNAVVAGAGIAGIGGAIATGMDVSGSISTMNMQLGLTGEAAALAGDEVKAVMSGGVAGSAEEAAEAVGALHSNIRYLGFEGEQTAAELADNFLGVSEVFGVDMAEATQVAGQLLTNGLAADAEHAADLMTVAMQRVPVAMRDEIPDIINEYGTFFSSMGMDGEDAFGLIVNAAQNGKIEMDKVGDAIKEFSIRATDLGDTGAVEALDALGLAGADVQNRLLAGGETAKGAFDQVVDSLLAVKDPAAQAEMAVALFGTPLEDLDKAKIPAFLAGMNDAAAVMGDVDGASQELADTMAGSLSGRLDALKGTAASLAGDGFMFLWDKAVLVSDWAKDNQSWLGPLLVGFGALAGIIGGIAVAQNLWNAALGVYKTIQAIATGQQLLFNAALLSNPITWVVAALVGLTAGLVYFFTQTETGREMWDKFTTALSDGWDLAVGALSAGWEWLKTTVFDAWTNTVAAVQAHWNLTTNAIAFAWAWVKDQFVTTWNTVKTAVFDAWNNAVTFLQASWNLTTNALAFAWAWVKDQFVYVWTVVKATVFDAWNAAVTWVQENFNQVTGAISSAWSWLKDQLHAGYTWVKSNVFDAMTSALDTVKGWFSTTVDTIGTIWEKLRALTAKPVRFVVETVYGGIRNAWNKVAGLVGLGELPEVGLGELGNYARGGVLPGYTPGRDVHEFYSPTGGRIHLSGGEAIMRPEWVRAVGGPSAVDEMNRAAREGKTLAAGPHDHYALGGVWDLGAFATGGTLRKNPGVVLTTDIQRSMERAVAAAFPNQIITSATRYQEMGSGYDNHMAGRALDFAASHALADWIARTYPHSAELFWDPGPNLKNGRPTGAIGGHSDHVHWAMASMVDPYTGEVVSQDGPGGGGGFSLLDMAKGMWDKAIGAIGKFPGAETMGTIGKLPEAALSTLATGAWNFLRDKFAAVGSFFGGGGGGEQYRGQIEAAFRNQGEVPHKHLVDALVRQIDSESGGDPNVAQQIVDENGTGPSAGLGLYQFIPGTFAAYRDPSLPNDRTDPWAAHNAAVRYFRDRHNWNTGPGGVGRGHGWKSGGVLPLDLATLFDTGGVWKHGTAGVNLSGADEYVFTNRAMRSFTEATESLRVVATELSTAYNGGDWGYMELASYIGDDMAKATIDVVAAVGRADRGFREWAAGDEERARMGTPEEWARHFGAQAGVAVADDVLGLFGLGGVVGGKFSDSFVNLVNAGADTVNGLHGTTFGHLQTDALQARAIIDDEGRVIDLDPASPIVDEPAAVSVAAAPTSADVSDSPVGAAPSGGSTTVIELDGGKVYDADDLEKLNGRVDGVEFRVKKLEDDSVAGPGDGVGLI